MGKTAELDPTPTDRLGFGIPLPILLFQEPGAKNNLTNYHHGLHPAASFDMEDIADSAVRQSTGLRLPRWLHNRYHNLLGGPQLPETDAQRLTLLIGAYGGVIPDQAIDLREGGKWSVVDLSREQWEALARSGNIGPEPGPAGKDGQKPALRNAGMFMASQIVGKVGLLASEKIVGQFLNPRLNSEQKTFLGGVILKMAADIALEPIGPLLETARDEGLILTSGKIPTTPYAVVRSIFTRTHRMRALRDAEKVLLAAA